MTSAATILPAAVLFLILVGGSPAAAQEPPRIVIDLEGGAVWQSRNDVRIPNEGGTRFSIADLIGARPSAAGRVQVTWRIAGRHSVRGVWAPLDVTGAGTPDTPILFAGSTFSLDAPIEATYQFTSYRATYRYRVFEGETWTWHVGGTAFVRDAKVALAQGAIAAKDTDVGFVPLGHVDAAARLGPRWTLTLDLDGSAAPQGRAIDFASLVRYQLSERWAIGGGYRTVEGGADVTRVYTFAWLNGLVASASLRF
jgi:hypothetical protein